MILLIFRQVLVVRVLSLGPVPKKPSQIRIVALLPIAGQAYRYIRKKS
jgi:hypothetical protein